jgi:bifunctional enzyme CysN/CysC
MPHTAHKHAAYAAPNAAEAQQAVENYIAQQERLSLLRFITCGSVDDGKSTLIGRMLWEAKQIYDDQVSSLKSDSKKHGTQGENIDFALLVDGLAAEREQGITIDVAYRFFSTDKRKFIVADTPGHEQYTRNMVTGASTADVAILLIDARSGVLTQTRRHAYLVSLMGIRHVVLAINKMDLVYFDPVIFKKIQDEFNQFSANLGFKSVTPIPLSALKGDNIFSRSANTHWYNGPTLLGYLETVNIEPSAHHPFVFPVQWVNRPNQDFRGFTGTIADGNIRAGDEIRVTATGQTATIASIVSFDGNLSSAQRGQSVTLTLDREIDISRGDVLSLAQNPLETTDNFEATVVWMSDESGLPGRTYDLKLSSQWTSASITSIEYRVDINTLNHESHKKLEMNDISVCRLSTSKPLAFDTFEHSKALGSFILVDRFTQATVGAGIIRHSLRRAQNIHMQTLSVTRLDRERQNGHKGKVFWFTGFSGSGKSTIANAFEIELHKKGYRTYILDGDNVRHGLNKDLGFTDEDRVENIRRVAEVAKLMVDAGLVVITAFISPFRSEREFARSLFEQGQFTEVFVDTPIEICENRDPKGLYKKARLGQLPNLTGIGSAYEPPIEPEIQLKTSNQSVDDCVAKLITTLA